MSADGLRRDAPPARDAHADPRLEQLLSHPALWRAGSASRQLPVWPSGFAPLDEGLPGGGWPRSGLIEILPVHFGLGELRLMLPAVACMTERPEARWCTWVAPPLQPFAPALAAARVALARLLIVRVPERTRGSMALWAFEQALGSGACDCVLAWVRHAPAKSIRRLHLAAQRGNTLGVLFRTREAERESSPAMLRLALEAHRDGVRVRLLKSRGGARGAIDLTWAAGEGEAQATP